MPKASPINDLITAWVMAQPVGSVFTCSSVHAAMHKLGPDLPYPFSSAAASLALRKLTESGLMTWVHGLGISATRGAYKLIKNRESIEREKQASAPIPLLTAEPPPPAGSVLVPAHIARACEAFEQIRAALTTLETSLLFPYLIEDQDQKAAS